MESVEVHSKNFLIRWVDVEQPSLINWQVVPQKRSINFGVFVHHGSPDHSFAETTGSLAERLHASGFQSVSDGGLKKLEGETSRDGTIKLDRKALLAFVFDNTFSISNSKRVQFSFNVVPATPAMANDNATMEPQFQQSSPAGELQPSAVAAAAAAANAALYKPAATTTTATAAASATEGPPNLQLQTSIAPVDATAPAAASTSRKLSLSRAKSPEIPILTKSKRRGTTSSQTGSIHGAAGGPDDDSSSILKLRHRQNTGSSTIDGGEGEVMKSLDGRFVNGFLQKKRRKHYQGFARRYFSLDKETGLLKYYLNNRTSSLRGVMPIKIAEVKVDRNNLQFTLNSGMERWTLKAHDPKTFTTWCTEVREVRTAGSQDEGELGPDADDQYVDEESPSLAAITSSEAPISPIVPTSPTSASSGEKAPQKLLEELPSLEVLRSLIPTLPAGDTRNLFEEVYSTLVKEETILLNKLAASRSNGNHHHHHQGHHNNQLASSKEASPAEQQNRNVSRKSPFKGSIRDKLLAQKLDFPQRFIIFQKRIKSRYFIGLTSVGFLIAALFGITYGITFMLALVIVAAGCFLPWNHVDADEREQFVEAYSNGSEKKYHFSSAAMDSLYGGSFSVSGGSDDDDEAGEFSDASDEEDKTTTDSVSYVPQKPNYDQMLWHTAFKHFQQQDGDSSSQPTSQAAPGGSNRKDDDGSSKPTSDEATHAVEIATGPAGVEEHGKSAETSLYPLPHSNVHRRREIKGPVQSPPSLLSLLKKAKDPSNMTAPITSNEPLSGVESTAEMYENSDLLDAASRAPPKSNLRMNLVAVFAVARLSSQRIKERALRKPFTPLLGETYEMVREDRGFRFLAEKVMHKPEVVATQAESPLWTVHFTSRPHTKMWAKTIQLTDVGHFSVTFPDGETVSFMNPELFIRNIIAGERYVEPSGTVTLESSADPQLHSVIEYKAGGMFSGRTEEVKISSGSLVYEGKWTESIMEGSKRIWSVKPLVDNPAKHYGWPVFTAQLNQITPIEENQLPPNDSRLRPDLRLYEGQADIEGAETLKLTLEQHQRERRKELEVTGKSHEPFFFVKTKDSLGHYVLKHGDQNYWVLRQKNDWSSVPSYFK